MDTRTPSELPYIEFLPGTAVIYAMHGKCNIVSIETRKLGEENIEFYKLEIKKSTTSRSTRSDSAIWVPVSSAKDRGLRSPMSKLEAESALKVLMSREYFFKTTDTWASLLPRLEATIRIEGGIGLAKVASFLFVLKKKQFVATPEVNKLQETVHKLLFKELTEALGEPVRSLEERIIKGFKTKLLPDH